MKQPLAAILTFAIAAASCAGMRASSFKPIISNFSIADYANDAGMQNWGLAQGPNGEMYIGNNKGLLSYDGYNWRRYPVPGDIIIRSVFVDDGKVYVGSYEEFGYFARNGFGELAYTSLSAGLDDFPMETEEVWNIIKHDGKIYFQTFNSAFAYDGETVTPIHDDKIRPLYFHIINGKIFAQDINGDYYSFDGRRYAPAIPRGDYGDDNIVAALQNGGTAILCTENKGLFSWTGNAADRIKPFPTQIDDRLRHDRINRAILTTDSTLIIGTLLDGIYAIDTKGRLKWHYNTENGLLNNSVLRLLCDRDNNVWAALDNGIALVHCGASFSIMLPDRNDTQIGMIYDILLSGGGIYMATNQGLYFHDSASGSNTLIPGTGGQNWHISRFGTQTFLGNNLHTMAIDGMRATPINPTSSSTCMRRCVINGKEIILEASYSELRVYASDGEKWTIANPVADFIAPVRQIEIDHSGTVWAANMSKGVYRIELSPDLKRVASATHYKSLNDSTPAKCFVMKARGRIVLSDNTRLYTFDDIAGKIIPYTELNEALVNPAEIHSATAVDANTFWLSSSSGYILMTRGKDGFRVVHHIPTEFFGLQNNENNDKVVSDNGMAYFNINNGIVRCDVDALSRAWTVPALRIVSASTINDKGEPQSLPAAGGEKARAERNIKMLYSFPNFNREKITFRFSLHKGDETGPAVNTASQQMPEMEYTNLSYGDYTLTAQAIDSRGKTIATTVYSFSVPRPFLLSLYAVIIYALAALAGVYFFAKWRTDKALRKKRIEYEAERSKQNIKMLEQEKLIALQQQQLLQTELSDKSKQLANLALNVYTKEEVIKSLKESMVTQKYKNGHSKDDMDSLLRKIEAGVGNIEFWDIYQKNFDLIHEHFFRNLRERYPSLTASDLKFCALLRLNLTTKDIAKFTNLSIRGVETARYRLRKKLGLPEKASLIEFLIDLK